MTQYDIYIVLQSKGIHYDEFEFRRDCSSSEMRATMVRKAIRVIISATNLQPDVSKREGAQSQTPSV